MPVWNGAPIEDAAGPPIAVEPVTNAETPEARKAREDAEIQAWLDAKAKSEAAVAFEREARAIVTSSLFPTPKKGTQRYPLANGYAIKLVYGLTPTLGDKDKVDDDGEKISIESQVDAVEEKINALGPVAALLLRRLIKWKPELSLSEFEKLDKNDPVEVEIAKLIGEILTVKPASPQLAFEEPKGK